MKTAITRQFTSLAVGFILLLAAVPLSAQKAVSPASMSTQDLSSKLMTMGAGRFCEDPEAVLPYAEEFYKRGQAEWKKTKGIFDRQHAEASELRRRGIKQVDMPHIVPVQTSSSSRYLYSTYFQLGRMEDANRIKDDFFKVLSHGKFDEARRAATRSHFYSVAGMDTEAALELRKAMDLAKTKEELAGYVQDLQSCLAVAAPESMIHLAEHALQEAEKLPLDNQVTILHSFGNIYRRNGHHQKALDIFKETVALLLKGSPDDWLMNDCNQQELFCRVALGEWETAREAYLQRIKSAKPNADDPTANLRGLIFLADLAGQAGKIEEGRGYLKQAREMLGRYKKEEIMRIHALLSTAAFRVGELEAALEHWKHHAKETPKEYLGESTAELLSLKALGRAEELAKLREERMMTMRQGYSKYVRYLAEGQLATDWKRNHLLSSLLNTGNDALSVEAIMALKGLASDIRAASMADRAGVDASKKTSEWHLRFSSKRERLAQLSLQASNGLSKAESAELGKLSSELAAMERAAGNGGRRQAVIDSLQWTVGDWEKKLPAGSVALNYVRFPKFGVKAPEKHINDPLGSTSWYGVAVISPGMPARFVELGSASEIDGLCRDFRNLVAKRNVAAEEADLALEKLCKVLYDKLVVPAVDGLPENSELMISADGMLHFLPFGAFLTPSGASLLESRGVQFVTSFRNLQADQQGKLPEVGSILMVGGVDYQAKIIPDNALAMRGEHRMGLAGGLESIPAAFSFKALPGTSREVEQIAGMFQNKSWEIVNLQADNATESKLFEGKRPTVLHLATHGYFFDVSNTTADIVGALGRKLVDPMAFAGLALAGAQPTIEAWRAGAIPPLANDGLLLASELATRNLAGVELLVLSACDTAAGELKDGESVAGFAKACAQAGANRSLLTLWPISDEATVAVMNLFYQKMLSGKAIHESLREAQSESFRQTRSQKGLREAVFTAMPFVLMRNGSRAPEEPK